MSKQKQGAQCFQMLHDHRYHPELLLGLKWQDINLNGEMLQVRRSLTRMPTGQGYKEIEPKTKSGRRGIALAPFAVEALRQHWQCQQEEKTGEVSCGRITAMCSANRMALILVQGMMFMSSLRLF